MNKDSWKWKTLGSISDIHDYKRKPITKKDRKIGIYPYYGATGIQDYIDNYIFDGSFVLVGEDGAKWGANENTAFLINGKFWVNNHAHVLQMHNDIFPKWVVYYLNHKDLNEFITGAVVPKLNQAALRSIPIPVPFISIQKQIVEELDTLSDIITKKKEQFAELDKLAQATFYDMFGDPIKNEKRWVNKKLSEVCHFVGGGTPPKANQNYYQGAIPWATVRDMSSFYLKNTEFKINEEAIKKSATNIIPKGSIIIATRVGLGKVCLLKQDTAINQDLKGVIPNEELNNIYLGYWFKEMADEIIANGEGATVKGVTLKFIHNLNIFLPPILFQTQFAEKIEAIDQQKALINQSITDTQLLFDYTMDKYFN